MLKIKLRQMYRSNGLMDDVHVHGTAEDYLQFAEQVRAALTSTEPIIVKSDSTVCVEISKEEGGEDLFTSLQNEDNDYFSEADWESRNILRVIGSAAVLGALADFLTDLAGRGDGYSYISDFSVAIKYSIYSPEWRLYVDVPNTHEGESPSRWLH